jgi:DNA-binding transcriptional regulator GbsR (MarR family)
MVTHPREELPLSRDESVAEIEQRVAEVIGRLMEYWGFKAVMGRLWTFLYLSSEPLTAAELGERLAMSTGSISMAAADLQKWGVIRKTWRPGERKDFYEAETSIWKMVTRVIRERELVHVHDAISAFEAAKTQLTSLKSGASVTERARLKFIEGRLTTLLALSRVGEGLINLFVAGKPVDLAPLRSLFGRGSDMS